MEAVLLVEDDPVQALVSEEWLREAGFEACTVGTVHDAHTEARRRAYDVVVTDMRLPDGDGIDVLRMCLAVVPNAGLVMMSGRPRPVDFKASSDFNVVKFLVKPISQADFLSSVRKAIELKKGFRGAVHGIPLLDFLQVLHLGRRSIRLLLQASAQRGLICFENGEIIHAEWGSEEAPQEGTDALRALLSLDVGTFDMASPLAHQRTTIRVPFSGLLLDLVRITDEESRKGPSARPGGTSIRPSASLDDEWSLVPPPLPRVLSSPPEFPQTKTTPSESDSTFRRCLHEVTQFLSSLEFFSEITAMALSTGPLASIRGTVGPNSAIRARMLCRKAQCIFPTEEFGTLAVTAAAAHEAIAWCNKGNLLLYLRAEGGKRSNVVQFRSTILSLAQELRDTLQGWTP